MSSRMAVLITGMLLLLVTACGGGNPDPGGRVAASEAEVVIREDVPSALEDLNDPNFPPPLINPDDVKSGGPPPDGIPPIDVPRFDTAADVDWLADNEPVLSMTVQDETRAYPLQVMTWHEIVNDTVGGVPVAVTYCPLCNSGVAFEREAAGRLLSFGTSGRLYADNLIMYDRQTESLWPQLTGLASIGVLTGEQLTAIPMGTVAWSDFRAAHPDSKVLNRDTGFARDYGRNPYVGYDNPDTDVLFSLPGEADERLAVKERVIGVGDGTDAWAIVRSSLVGSSPKHLSVGTRDLVVWHAPGQASALDTGTITDGADIGTVGVFEAAIDGQQLTFTCAADGFRDDQTKSTWNVSGRATSGPLVGEQLTWFEHLDTFWFAWVTFKPDTKLIGQP